MLDDVRPLFGTQDDENLINDIIRARNGETFAEGDEMHRRRMLFVTTNLTASELEGVIGAAAFDRLAGNCGRPLVCDWPSYRQLETDE